MKVFGQYIEALKIKTDDNTHYFMTSISVNKSLDLSPVAFLGGKSR